MAESYAGLKTEIVVEKLIKRIEALEERLKGVSDYADSLNEDIEENTQGLRRASEILESLRAVK